MSSFCAVIVWQAPSRAYGVIVGYDVRFLNSGNDEEDGTMITKDRDELFHRVEQRNLPNGRGSVLVQVHTCTDSGRSWGFTIPLFFN